MNPLSTYPKKAALHLGAILAICTIIWGIALTGHFLSWDDEAYTISNPDIYTFSFSNIGKWFSRFYLGNYHPLTMASFAIDYLIAGKNPTIYHLSAILIHTLNCLLVYKLICILSKQTPVAVLTAVLFAIHPVQAESVMWIAERKTLLAGTFSLAACCAYLNCLEEKGNRAVVAIWCLAAMLSKGTATALPFSLLAIDLWSAKRISKNALANKIPLILLSFTFGYIAFLGQVTGGFIADSYAPNIGSKLLFSGAALASYVSNTLVPVHLSAMYPYPKHVSAQHIAGAIGALSLLGAAAFFYKRKLTVPAAGILFFTINLLPVLQLVRFGETLLADRYLYISCIGLFYPIAHYAWSLRQQLPRMGSVAVGAAMLVLGYTTSERNKNWLSDDNFFRALLIEHPNSAVALYSVATLRMRAGDLEAAKLLLNKAVEMEPQNYKAWFNKAILHLKEGRNAEALLALNQCLALSEYTKALLQRSMLYQRTGNYSGAISDATSILEKEPANARAWYVKGTALEKTGDEMHALVCFENAIHFAKNEPAFYIGHALALDHAGRKKEALSDLKKATEIAPSNADAHYYLGLLRYRSGINPCSELESAAALGLLRAKQALVQLCH